MFLYSHLQDGSKTYQQLEINMQIMSGLYSYVVFSSLNGIMFYRVVLMNVLMCLALIYLVVVTEPVYTNVYKILLLLQLSMVFRYSVFRLNINKFNMIKCMKDGKKKYQNLLNNLLPSHVLAAVLGSV